MKAPEKIYLQENTTTDCYDELWPEWFEARAKDADIEYTRTDAFIEKASEWLGPVFKELSGYYSGAELLDDFKNYMKGE